MNPEFHPKVHKYHAIIIKYPPVHSYNYRGQIMDSTLHLNDGEKLVLECRPRDALVTFALYRGIIPLIILLILYILLCCIFDSHIGADTDPQEVAYFHKAITLGVMLLFFYFGLLYLINTIAVPQFRYIFTDQRCIIYSGFIGVNKRVIPYNRIADVNIRQGTVEALLSLSTVFIDEQAMNYSNGAWIRGLDMNDAEEITKIVSAHISKKQN
jgi:membrane protein YdbS with pleckstrin-like domain